MMRLAVRLRPVVARPSTRPLTPIPRRLLLRAYSYPREGVFQHGNPRRANPNPPVPHGHGPPHDGSMPQQTPTWQEVPEEGPTPSEARWALLRGTVKFLATSAVLYLVYHMSRLSLQATTLGTLAMPFEPDSEDDLLQLQDLQEEFDELPFVQSLRMEEEVKDGAVTRIWREWDAYQGIPHDSRENRLTTGPLRGSGGVGAQKIFYNESTGEFIAVVNFGEATSTLPPGVHSGVIATIFDETMGRCAVRQTEAKTAVTASLELTFLEPTRAGQWYAVLAKPHPVSQDTSHKKHVMAVMYCLGFDDYYPILGQNSDEGDPSGPQQVHYHAVADALFVVPKNVDIVRQIEDDF